MARVTSAALTNSRDMSVERSLLELRQMTLDDLDTVMKVENAAYPIPWSRGVFTDCIQSKRNDCWLALVDGQVCGHSVVSHVLDETHLLNICVAPEFAGNGLGRVFLRLLIEQAVKRGSTCFYLEVRVSNKAAINLYFSEGFNEVGVRPSYYPSESGREDALLMTRELSISQYV